MFRLNLRTLVIAGGLMTYHYRFPFLKNIRCIEEDLETKKNTKFKINSKLNGKGEDITGIRSTISIAYIFIRRYYLAITKLTLRVCFRFFYENAIIIGALLYLILS